MRSRLLPLLLRPAAGLCCLLAIACDSGPPEGTWRKIERPGFTFELPGKPEFKEESMEAGGAAIPQQSVNLYRGQEQFAITVIDFSNSSAAMELRDAEILEKSVQGGLERAKGTSLSDRTFITSTGHAAREVTADITNPVPARLTLHLIWSKPHMYMVSYSVQPPATESPDGRKFINSFQLTTK